MSEALSSNTRTKKIKIGQQVSIASPAVRQTRKLPGACPQDIWQGKGELCRSHRLKEEPCSCRSLSLKLPGEGYLLRPWASVTQTSGNPGQRQGLPLNPESSAPGSARARGQRRNCQERSSCRINRRRRHPPYEDSLGCHLRVRQCNYPRRDQHSPHECP